MKDQVADQKATSAAAQERLFKARVERANQRIAAAKRHRAEIRKALLLDED